MIQCVRSRPRVCCTFVVCVQSAVYKTCNGNGHRHNGIVSINHEPPWRELLWWPNIVMSSAAVAAQRYGVVEYLPNLYDIIIIIMYDVRASVYNYSRPPVTLVITGIIMCSSLVYRYERIYI